MTNYIKCDHTPGYFQLRISIGENLRGTIVMATMKDHHCGKCDKFMGTELFKNQYKPGVYTL